MKTIDDTLIEFLKPYRGLVKNETYGAGTVAQVSARLAAELVNQGVARIVKVLEK